MARIIAQYDSTNTVGKMYRMEEGDTTKTELTMPANLTATDTLPVYAAFKNKLYIAGMWNRILVWLGSNDVYVAGLEAPLTAPTITASGSGSLTGSHVPYLTYVHKTPEGKVLVESNLSPAGDAVDMSGAASRVWSNLPTATQQGVNERATHIRGWVADKGALPRLAWERVIGTTSVTEGMGSAFLSQQPVTPNDGQGGIVLNRIPPKYCRYIAVYHRRMYYAGFPDNPGRVMWSELDEPEAVGEESYEETRDGESVTGLHVWGGKLMVFCDKATYSIRGWTDGADGVAPDIRMEKEITGPGCISHHSIVDINDRLWYADRDGIRVYDGGFRYAMTGMRNFWRTDFAANTSAYFRCQAVDFRTWGVYWLLVPKSSAFYWVGHYLETDPIMGGVGRDPVWTHDKRSRKDSTLGVWKNSDGTETVVIGSCDGYVRQEDSTDTDDDGDTLAKQVKIQKYVQADRESGPDRRDGATLHKIWSYLQSESYPWNIAVEAGDESALDVGTAHYTDSVAASSSGTQVAKDVHNHPEVQKDGRGFAVTWTTNTTDGVDATLKFRGFGINTKPGGTGMRGSTA